MKVTGIIPARWASARFPGKPLANIQGKPMIEWVYGSALAATQLDALIVATDDERIAEVVRGFGGEVRMTRSDHQSGTDRCAEVALQEEASIIVNIQGDEPFAHVAQIDQLVQLLKNSDKLEIATLAKPIHDAASISNPDIVKVVFDRQHRARYFSRSVIPYNRNDQQSIAYYRHLGLYAYRKSTLLALHQLAPSALELAESLEQLRWLENGYEIGVGITHLDSIGVDRPADIQRAEAYLNSQSDHQST